MKNTYRIFYGVCMLFASFGKLHAQDFTFSQFSELPLLRNPALAGIFTGDMRVQAAHRSQWAAITTPFENMAFSTELKFPVGSGDNYFTSSMLVTNDVAGDSKLSKLQLMPAVNYLLSFDDNSGYMALGFMGGFSQTRYDPTAVSFDDQFQNGQFNPNNATSQTLLNTNETHFDMSTGVTYSDELGYGSKFYVGAAIYHLNRPKVGISSAEVRLNRRFVINGGLSLATGDNDDVYIFGDHIAQTGSRQTLVGLLFSHRFGEFEDDAPGFGIGAMYRWSDAFIPTVKLQIGKINFGLSYDVNVSSLKTVSQGRGGFEITASFKSYLNIRNSSADKVKCPVGF
jgi:type IX secretion system PorP/SprF family membrane protein